MSKLHNQRECVENSIKSGYVTVEACIYDAPLYNQKDMPFCMYFALLMIESQESGIVYSQDEAKQKVVERAEEYYGRELTENELLKGVDFISASLDFIWEDVDSLFNAFKELGHGAIATYFNGHSGHAVSLTGMYRLRGCDTLMLVNNPWGSRSIQTYDDFFYNGVSQGGGTNTNYWLTGIYTGEFVY